MLDVACLHKSEIWSSVKGSSPWVEVVFTNSEYPTERSNFLFSFKIKASSNLSDFSSSLLDSEEKIIEFSEKDKDVSQLEFRKDILKQKKEWKKTSWRILDFHLIKEVEQIVEKLKNVLLKMNHENKKKIEKYKSMLKFIEMTRKKYQKNKTIPV